MRFLFLCTTFPKDARDSYMTSELAAALVSAGHDVDVLHLDWNGEFGARTERSRSQDGYDIVRVGPRTIRGWGRIAQRASKFLLTSRHAAREMEKSFDLQAYDVVIGWTPALTIAAPLKSAMRAGVDKSLLFIFDFFPIHHMEIGMVPRGPVYWIAKAWENRVYRKFSAILCNFPGNVSYLKKHYRLRSSQRVSSTPLWSVIDRPDKRDPAEVRRHFGLPVDRRIAIFGGQITEGRGIELMLQAADEAHHAGSELIFLFVGDGRLVPEVQARAVAGGNVMHLKGVPRDLYLTLVSACNVGLVATVPGVSSFSFPTKTIDYLRAGLPVVAAVENGSDYVEMLSRYEIGEAVSFGDPQGFFRTADRLGGQKMGDSAFEAKSQTCLDEVFHVRRTVAAIENALGVSRTTVQQANNSNSRGQE